jgi:hypothetical protein
LIHILQWNGETYVEEAVLPTFGELAVLNIGDCDNDGENEIHAGSVMIEDNEVYMAWVYKYGIEQQEEPVPGTGSLRVTTKSSTRDKPLKNASVAAWNLEENAWYDIQPIYNNWYTYYKSNMPDGEYLLRALMDGYKIQETTITITEGQETTYDFFLQSASRHYSSSNTFFEILSNLRFFILK